MSRIAPSSKPTFHAIPPWLRGPWGAAGIASILYAIIHLLWIQFHWGGEANISLIANLSMLPPGLLALLMSWRVALHKQLDVRFRLAWLLFGLAGFSFLLGEAAWFYVSNVLHVEPFPSIADAFLLAPYPLLLWGLMTLPGAHLDRHQRILFWFDLLIMLTTASMFVGYFLIIPTAQGNDMGLLSKFLATAYPIGDLILVSGVLSLLLRLPDNETRAVLRLQLIGLSFFVASDLAFGYTSLQGTYAPGYWIDAGWMLAKVFMILCALRQLYRGSAPSTNSWWIVLLQGFVKLLPLLTILLGYGLALYIAITNFNETVEWMFIAAALLTILIIARQVFIAGFFATSIRTKLILTFLLVCVSSLELVSIFTYYALRAHPDSIWEILSVVTTIVVILTAGAAIFLAQRFVAPISRLTSVARQIAAGDLTAKAQIETQDEIGTLAMTFNAMLETLLHTREGLRQAEGFTRSIFSSLSAHVAVLDRHGQIVSVNQAWEDFARANGDPDLRHTGIGQNYLEVLRNAKDEPQSAQLLQGLQAVLEGRQKELIAEYACHSSTEKRWYLMNVTPLSSSQGGAVVSHTNMTESRLAQLALQESEERYRRLVDSSPDMIAVQRNGEYLYINPAGVKLLGAGSAEEIIGQKIVDMLAVQGQEWVQNGLETVQHIHEATPPIQQTLHRIDGTHLEAEFRAIPVSYEGKPAIQFILRDVSERKHLEEQWQQFKQGIERSSEAVFMTDVDGKISYINPAFEKLYGYFWDEAIGQTPRILKSGTLPLEVYQQFWATLLAKGTVAGEIVNCTKDGRLVDIEGSNSPILDERGNLMGFLSVHRDVTERKRTEKQIQQLLADAERLNEKLEIRVVDRTAALNALNQRLQDELAERLRSEEALRISEKKYRTIFENVQDVFYTTDYEGHIVTISPSIEKHSGYCPEEIIGNHVRKFFMDEENYRNLEETVSTHGMLNDYEMRLKRKDGSLIHVSAAARVVFDEHGQPAGTEGVLRDITERKQTELALQQAKELAEAASHAKSEFLSRMSHELRTPMNAILGFAQLLDMSHKDPLTASQKGRVKQIVKGGQHLLDLINEILDISRIEANRLQISPEPVSVRESIQDALDLTVPLAVKRHIQIVTKLGSSADNPFVMADRQRFKQILLNLLGNAVKYNYDGGSVIISCQQTPAKNWRISIADTGPGIPPEQHSRLFLPFERLVSDQSNVEGTGLGLTLAKHLVELMRGQIGVESAPGRGSTFWIELPPAESPMARLQRTTVTRELIWTSTAARTVLYVEDNVANFELIRQVLADHSQLEVLWAADFKTGLEIAHQHHPSLILLDLHLGGEDGAELLGQLKQDEKTAGIPIVVVSADATSGQAKRLTALGAHTFLTKPLDVKHFIRLVEELLREKVA